MLVNSTYLMQGMAILAGSAATVLLVISIVRYWPVMIFLNAALVITNIFLFVWQGEIRAGIALPTIKHDDRPVTARP